MGVARGADRNPAGAVGRAVGRKGRRRREKGRRDFNIFRDERDARRPNAELTGGQRIDRGREERKEETLFRDPQITRATGKCTSIDWDD